MIKVVAVLEVMWGRPKAVAPRWFKINPRNHSGRRLLYWTEGAELIVTNACKEVVASADQRGKPDHFWLMENLLELRPPVLLLCGGVAQGTFTRALESGLRLPRTAVIRTQHPAARSWTRESMEQTRREIQREIVMAEAQI